MSKLIYNFHTKYLIFVCYSLQLQFSLFIAKDKNEKKLIGFSFAKLMDDEGTTLKDGSHDLFIYKCDDRTKLKNVRSYLGLPFSNSSAATGGRVIGNQAFQRSLKESLSISSLLVSTKLTQNSKYCMDLILFLVFILNHVFCLLISIVDLVNLLKWKSNPECIKQTLDNMNHVSGEEIVKFLQDVLDALFSMFLYENGESCEYSGNVFIVLVNICVHLESGKFEHFKPVIDAYITDHFAAALVYKVYKFDHIYYTFIVILAVTADDDFMLYCILFRVCCPPCSTMQMFALEPQRNFTPKFKSVSNLLNLFSSLLFSPTYFSREPWVNRFRIPFQTMCVHCLLL